MPVVALAALALAPLNHATPQPLDWETDFDAASRLYDGGNAKAAEAKMRYLSKAYPNEYKGARLYHLEVALAADQKAGRVFANGLVTGPFAKDPTSLAGIAPAVEHLAKPEAATWKIALAAAKRAAALNPKSVEAQEAIGISYLGLGQKSPAKAAFTRSISLLKSDPRPDAVYLQWLVQRRDTLQLRKS